VFVCVAEKFVTNTSTLEPWCVSREYNTNYRNEYNETIAGRFVFQCPAQELKLVALAEEPAQDVLKSSTEVERNYIEVRKYHEPGSSFFGKRELYE